MSLDPVVSVMGTNPENDLGTQICDLPVEMLAKVLEYLTSADRQKLRPVCSAWNHVIEQLFETTLHVNDLNMTALLETTARFLHVRLSRDANIDFGLVNRSSFISRVQKLELPVFNRNLSWLRFLQHATSLKELLVWGYQYNYFRETGSELYIQEWEQTENFQTSTWLPKLKTLKFVNSNNEMLSWLANILQKGGLETLAIVSDRRDEQSHGRRFSFSEIVLKFFGLGAEGWDSSTDKAGNEFFMKIINASKTTLRKLTCRNSALEFNPRSPMKFYLRKFHTEFWLQRDGTFRPGLLAILNNQERLKELCLESSRYPPYNDRIEPVSFAAFISDIIARSAPYMTRVELKFEDPRHIKDTKEILDPIFANCLDTVFSQCVTLKDLKLEMLPYVDWKQYNSSNFGQRTQFKGITSLPSSLRTFRTSFPIATVFASIDDLDLPNLKNLEHLELTSNICFIFKNNHIRALSLDQIKELSLRLPKLKTILFNIAVIMSEKAYFTTIDSKLVTKFEKSLEKKEYQGVFLKIEIAQL